MNDSLWDLLVGTLGWLTASENWVGPDGIPTRTAQHLALTIGPTAVAVAAAIPLTAWLAHRGLARFLAVNLSNVGRALPSLALLGLFSGVFGFTSVWPTLLALFALAVPPLVTNTYVGVSSVAAEITEAAYGMGMSSRTVLRTVELPLAGPEVMASVRTATTSVVATATLAALFAQGGLGRYIIDGQATGNLDELFAGAILVAALALALDACLGALARALDPFRGVAGSAGPGKPITGPPEDMIVEVEQ